MNRNVMDANEAMNGTDLPRLSQRQGAGTARPRFHWSWPQGTRGRAVLAPNGFSMLEMIGVLAVVSILAALAVPSVIRQVDRASVTREISDLKTFSQALSRSIGR